MRSARTGDPGAAWPRADVSDRRRPRAGSRVDELLVLPAPQRDGGRRAAIADPHRRRELRPRVAAEVHLLPGGQEARRVALRDLPRRPQRLEGRAPGDLQLDDLGPVERKPPRSSFAPRIVFRTSHGAGPVAGGPAAAARPVAGHGAAVEESRAIVPDGAAHADDWRADVQSGKSPLEHAGSLVCTSNLAPQGILVQDHACVITTWINRVY